MYAGTAFIVRRIMWDQYMSSRQGVTLTSITTPLAAQASMTFLKSSGYAGRIGSAARGVSDGCFFSVVNWFRTGYSTSPKGQMAVNTLSLFEDLVRRGIAVSHSA